MFIITPNQELISTIGEFNIDCYFYSFCKFNIWEREQSQKVAEASCTYILYFLCFPIRSFNRCFAYTFLFVSQCTEG